MGEKGQKEPLLRPLPHQQNHHLKRLQEFWISVLSVLLGAQRCLHAVTGPVEYSAPKNPGEKPPLKQAVLTPDGPVTVPEER